ncbi:MAG: YceI family protein [Betaproteobacteria bacterium]
MRTVVVATVVAVLLAACAVQAPRSPGSEEQRPAGFPDNFYQRSADPRHPVFHIEPSRSLVVIEIRRDGSLAYLGHDHVIASHHVRGYVAPGDARADLFIPLGELVVDEPELRVEAGFATQPPDAAIAGTRENMLRRFHVEQHPFAVISVASVDADAAGSWLNASITLNGITRAARIPVKIEQTADQLTVSGGVALEQTSFGIAPFSILGGALQVQDRVDVRFVIHARALL